MDYLSRNSVVLDRIFHGFSLSLFMKLHIIHMHASVHAYKCPYTHTKCSYIAKRIMLDVIWLQFSYRGKTNFHTFVYIFERIISVLAIWL